MTTNIMVIDDERLIGELLRYQLSGAGYAVSVYQDAAQALVQLAYDRPDLVLLDVMMPGVSGWDVCRQIRAAGDTPVIMLTAKSADEDVVAGLNYGADDYICKPFTERQLLARIAAVLRRASAPQAPRRPASTTSPPPAAPYPAPRDRRQAPSSSVGAPAQPRKPEPPAPPAPPPSLEPQGARLGPALAAARRERGMSLHQAEQACGVRWEFLQAIEQEQFNFLPRPQLRSALAAYSDALGVDLSPYVGRRLRRRPLSDSLALTMIVAALCVLTLLLLAL